MAVENLALIYKRLASPVSQFLLQVDNELLVPKMQKKLGVTVFVSGIKRVVNYTDFRKLSHIIEHGLEGFIVENIKGESTEANDLSHIL